MLILATQNLLISLEQLFLLSHLNHHPDPVSVQQEQVEEEEAMEKK